MKRIEFKEYFDSVQAYFADNKEPARSIGSFWDRCERTTINCLRIYSITVSIRLKRQKTACDSALAQCALFCCVQSRENKIKMKFLNPCA